MTRAKETTLTLTKAEEQVMQALWKIGEGFAGEVAAAVEEPKPAYRTVLTQIRILEQKGFVAHRMLGGNNQYYPLIGKKDYSGRMLGSLIKNYFNASYTSLVSFFVEGGSVSEEELEALGRIIEAKRRDCAARHNNGEEVQS